MVHSIFRLSNLNESNHFSQLSHGVARVDDRRVISGIIYVLKRGLQWKDAPREYGPYKTLYNRFVRLEPPWRVQHHFCRIGQIGWFRRTYHD